MTYQHIPGTYTGQLSLAHACPEIKLTLSTRSDFAVAIATVNRPVTARFEGYFGILATLGAYHGKHLAWGSIAAVATVSVLPCFPCLAAFGTALWLISIALRLEKLLVLNAEGECSPTIGALERLVLKTHWITSSLMNFS